MRGLGITRRHLRDRLRRLVGEADLARDGKDWPAASRLYQQALDLDPFQPGIRVQLGHAHKEQGDLANAERCYRAALQLVPTDDDLYLQIGHLEKLKGNLDGAALAYRQSAELNPRNGAAAAEYAALAPALDLPGLDLPGLDFPPLDLPPLWPARANGASVPHRAVGNGSADAASSDEPDRPVAVQELRDRGDTARDARQWEEAAGAYQAYLAGEPADFAIWVQLGHALKESGDRSGSEGAYRTALRLDPDDWDVHLQLGHLLKLGSRTEEAVEAYRRSFELRPLHRTWNELKGLGHARDELAVRLPAMALRSPKIFLDISDLVVQLRTEKGVSGIQRVQLGMIAAALADTGSDGCHFVFWRDKELWTLPEPLLGALVPYGIPIAPSWEGRRELIREIEAEAEIYTPASGDTIIATGVLYHFPNVVAQRERLKRAGVRLGAYFHDFIPLTHPQFCAKILIDDFSKEAAEALLHLDFLLTVSEHVAAEARRLLRESGYPQIPVCNVPLAHGFEAGGDVAAITVDRWTPAIAGLRGREYVLCVGTLSEHKNQNFLVQVWQLLVQEGHDPPLLVLAGSRNWGADEALNRLRWSKNVGGHVCLIDTPTDQELAVLYRNCLFTLFPSLVEGWGLPIGESLAYGKLCLASGLASMPEVGGDFVIYIDPYSVRGCADLVRDLLGDRGQIAHYEARIRDEFRPRQWDEHGRDFLRAVRESATASAETIRPLLGTVAPGEMFAPRRALSDWRFGTALPPYSPFAEEVRGRAVLARGWRPAEHWGAWMAGRSARLTFGTTAPPGSVVTVLLQCRAVPWARDNLLRVTSACGATAAVAVPESGTTEARWRDQRYKEMVLGIDCTVLDGGSVDLSLEITGPLAEGWWGEARSLCIGLVRLVYLPAVSAPACQPNRRLRPPALTGPSGENAYPVGLQSMLEVLRGSRMLPVGWEPPGASVTWMSGGAAQVALSTEASPGEAVRVVLQLRSAPAPAGLEVRVTSDCGASTVSHLPGDSVEAVWLDCRVGADRHIRLDIAAPAVNGRFPGRRVGLVSLAYGRREAVEDRLALTEAMLFPAPDLPGSAHSVVLADLRFSIVGHLRGSYSLAAINRSLALGLEEALPGTVRVEQIETDPTRDLTGVPAGDRDAISALAERAADMAGAEVAIVQHWPVLPRPANCDLALALFVWEESLVPREIVAHLNRHYRGIITQTRAVKKALLDSGIAVPVQMVGCAIDLSRFAAIAERRAFAAPRPPIDAAHPFVFLHVSSCFPRKGADLLLDAYAQAFRGGDPVKLVIKTFPNPHNDVAEQIERLRAADPGAPEIELINEDLEETPLLRLYEEADAMVLPTRGEGFNMPAAEAMASGLPLIVTAHGGQADFVGPGTARTLDYHFAASQSHVRAAGSLWVEPDRADLVAALRESVAQARDAGANARGANARGAESPFAAQIERARRVVAPFGDRAAWGHRVAEAARRVLVADPARHIAVGWVSTWKVRCGIAEYSRHLLSHFEGAARDVTVFCDERTDPEQLATRDGPAAQVAWRVKDDASIDGLAAAIADARVEAVIVQHHRGYLPWAALARLLRDERVASRSVLIFIHNVRYLFAEAAADRADIIAALRLAACVLVHSVPDLNMLKSLGLIENVSLFPHGAERTDLTPPPARPLPSGSAPLLGAYGFFLPLKGFDRLIRALPALRGRWRGLRLRFVTAEYPAAESADALAECRELARSLGVAEAIEWITDYLPNRRSLELLNECDLIALPYQETTESASGAVRVALASRVPVAVTPIRIFDELDGAVLRFAGCEVEDIAVGIATFLDDATARREAIEATGPWLEAHDWKLMAARLQGMAAGIVATRRTGP
jgi:glycosyltransferase involved in cell wall biosynthesis/cytochrome c-type biogenesis protein CcmH/NrfG